MRMVEVSEILSTYYGLADVSVIKEDIGLVDENYIIQSQEGMYFFKRFRSISDQEFASLETTLASLKSHGVPVPMVMHPTRSLPVTADHTMLFEYVVGEPFTGSLPQLRSIASLYQHIIDIGLAAKTGTDAQVWQTWLTKTHTTLIQLGTAYPLTRAHHTIRLYFIEMLTKIQAGATDHALPAAVDVVPMHPDFTERNMLFDHTGAVNLICDWQGYGPRILPIELADYLIRFGLERPFHGVLDAKRTEILLSTLTESRPFLANVVSQYQSHLPALMTVKQIGNLPFRMSCYYSNRKPDLMHKIITWSYEFVQWLEQSGYSLL